MKNNFKYKIFAFALTIFIMTGCEKDFLEINDDPNNPLTVPTPQLLTAAQTNLAYNVSNGTGGLSKYTGIVVKHWVRRGLVNDYGLQGNDFAIGVAWTSIYAGMIKDLQVVEEQGTENGELGAVGAAQLMKAYIMSVAVDLWGEVPYFEVGQGAALEAPAYDDGSDIYADIFVVIDDAIANLKSGTSNINGDIIYNGSRASWLRLANSLKLKLLNNVRLTRNVSAEVAAVLNNTDGIIGATAQDFELDYGQSFNPENRNPGYVSDWAPGGGDYIDPFFFEMMRGVDTFGHGGLLPAGGGVIDPRIPYYFFNQLPAGSGNSAAENPCAYCPSRSGTPFLSIFSYSFNIDPNEGFDQGRSQTVGGLYPFGGRFNDGSGGIAANSSTLLAGQVSGPGDVPQRFLDNVEVAFILAELAQVGVLADAPRTLFEAAIDAAFAKVNTIASNAGAPSIAVADITTYKDAVLAEYDNAGAEGQLHHIMTQKWIAQFGNSLVSFNDIRRTGFPILHDGNTDNLAQTVQTRSFPVSIPYPINNLQLNANAPGQREIANDKIFWDID